MPIKCVADLNINISDNDGTLRDIVEIIRGMAELYKNFDILAMSEHTLFLQGQKDMLGQIIGYLMRI